MDRWCTLRSRLPRLFLKRYEATVVNARFVKPLDAQLLLALARTKRLIVTVEEPIWQAFWLRHLSCLKRTLAGQGSRSSYGIPDRLVDTWRSEIASGQVGPDADGIYTRVKEHRSF